MIRCLRWIQPRTDFAFLVVGALLCASTSDVSGDVDSLTLHSSWVLDSESTLVGAVGTILTRDDRTYILDRQLEQVLVLSADGEVLDTFGQQGEAPGEYRYPTDLVLLPTARIGVVQMSPPKIAIVSSSGEPLEDFFLGEAMESVWSVKSVGNSIVMKSRINYTTSEEPHRVYLLRCRLLSGEDGPTYIEASRPAYPGGLFLTGEDNLVGPWEVGPDGRVYASDQYEDYSIRVFAPDGTELKSISRRYNHVLFSDTAYEQRKKYIADKSRRVGNRHPPKASRYLRDIQSLHVRPDGFLWVRPSDGQADPEAGVLGEFDVFSADGDYVRRLRIFADFDPAEDTFSISGNKLFVVKNNRGAWRAMYAANKPANADRDDTEETAEPLRIVCYVIANVHPSTR